jgi:large subunit ribosomal protein L3
MRTGTIAKKLGMSRLFDENGLHIPVTILQLEDVYVVAHKTVEKNGYDAVQLSYGKAKANRVMKPLRGQYTKSRVLPGKKLKEFRISSAHFPEIGAQIAASHYVTGQFVDISGRTIGKGFSGAMKRWNFAGLEASHGVSISHRSHGSTGQRQDPGKVFKGKKMAGHLGHENVTVLNLEIVKINNEENTFYVKGAVPGHVNSYIFVRDAIKKALPKNTPLPAGFKRLGLNVSLDKDLEFSKEQ